MKIKVVNPYYDKTYKTNTITIEQWKQFILNHKGGNEQIIDFYDNEGNYVTLNPAYYASVEVER